MKPICAGFFFFQFIFPSFAWCSAQKHNKAHLESSCVKCMVSSRASLECRASCLHKPGLAAVSRWNRSPPSRSRPSCFGKRCPGRRKAAVLLTLSSTINAMVPDTFFFFYTPFTIPPPPPPPPVLPYLPHLESIKQLGKEGKNPSTPNVFTMSGKARETPF